MAEHILLVFEGEKTEKQIYQSMTRYFLNESPNTVICALYCSNIYSLYHKVQSDQDLELFSLLKESEKNKEQLESISRDDVSQIYLFFDYDGHDTAATDLKLFEMLSHFNEETENGKLYISYPMVEAIKHIHADIDFQETVAIAKEKVGYKEIVSNECDKRYQDLTSLTLDQWNHIISEHCQKMNFIVNGSFLLPASLVSQLSIYEKQKVKFIDPNGVVSVLSAFPIFIVDYYGWKHLPLILGRTN